MDKQKHAYLIIAHKSDYTFEKLIEMLDDYRNDIYIHMDKKNKCFDENKIRKFVKYSNVYFTKRIKVEWGDYSIVNVELLLLKAALNNGKYQYYHLLSGQDLPLKTQDYIHNFFDINNGKEFIRFQNELFNFYYRVSLYYFFQSKIGRNSNKFWILINKISVAIQKLFRIKRNKNINFQKGTQWFSITDDLAKYIVSKEEWIKKTFNFTIIPDELFIQTLVNNSKFKDKLYRKEYDNNIEAIMRLIDWNRGNPYIFKLSDLEELISSNMIFARKFDSNVDKEIIDKIFNLVNVLN